MAQKKHPWIGKELNKKYSKLASKIRMENLRKKVDIKEHFSKMAKRLQELNPNHSKQNMEKAHQTMMKKGNFYEHQRLAAIKCMEKRPNHLKEMSKKAHELYPLALLALESHRRNYPFEFMNSYFDSNQERFLCKKLIENELIIKPIEGENIHFRIGKCHIDFFIQNKIFLEFHPPIKFGNKKETVESYYLARRKLLDENGFEKFPLILISHINEIDTKLQELKNLILPQS